MLDELWNIFNKKGYIGSLSIRNLNNKNKMDFSIKTNSSEDDSFIHKMVYEIDPDYIFVCVIKSGINSNLHSSIIISLDNNFTKSIDNAILKGLCHIKSFKIKESDAIVLFGYYNDALAFINNAH